MFNKLKMVTLKKIRLTCFVLLAIGCVALGLSEFRVIDYFREPTPIEDIALEDLEGKYVEMNVDVIYDFYAQTVETKNGLETGKINSQEYIIPVGESEFMGMYIPEKMISVADKIMYTTIDVLNEEAEELEAPMTVQGTVTQMDSQQISFYQETVGYDELDETTQAAFLPYVLKVGFVGSNVVTMMWFYTLLGIVLIGMALFMLIRAFAGGYQKAVRVFCKENGEEESMHERLENFYDSTEPMYGIRVNSSYIMFNAGALTHAANTPDVAWIYQKTTKHRVNFIPTYNSYAIAICMRDGRVYEVACGNKNKTEAALECLASALPKAVVGYSEELESLYKHDRTRFCGLKEEIANAPVSANCAPLEAEMADPIETYNETETPEDFKEI